MGDDGAVRLRRARLGLRPEPLIRLVIRRQGSPGRANSAGRRPLSPRATASTSRSSGRGSAGSPRRRCSPTPGSRSPSTRPMSSPAGSATTSFARRGMTARPAFIASTPARTTSRACIPAARWTGFSDASASPTPSPGDGSTTAMFSATAASNRRATGANMSVSSAKRSRPTPPGSRRCSTTFAPSSTA